MILPRVSSLILFSISNPLSIMFFRMFAGSNGASSGGGPMGANNGPCSACGQAIPASELVMRAPGGAGANGAAGGAVFHLACFVCSKCGGHLRQGDR